MYTDGSKDRAKEENKIATPGTEISTNVAGSTTASTMNSQQDTVHPPYPCHHPRQVCNLELFLPIQYKVNNLEIERDQNRLDFLLTDMNYYISIASKLKSQRIFNLTSEEKKTMYFHNKTQVLRPDMAGVFDRMNRKGRSAITARKIEEAEYLLNSHPSFVKEIVGLRVETVQNNIQRVRKAVAEYIDEQNSFHRH